MTTLTQLLETPNPNADEACIAHAVRCSPFVQRLLGTAELLPELLSTLHTPWTEQAMRDWLAAQQIDD